MSTRDWMTVEELNERAEPLDCAVANGRNPYFGGQFGAEEPEDTAARLALVTERDALLHMATWAYSKLHHFSYTKQEDALMLDRLKLMVERGIF